MLTSELAISRRRGDRIFPYFIKTNHTDYLRDAAHLIQIFAEFEGKTRGELERELEAYIGNGTDYRVLRGFIKLLNDNSLFETASIAEPSEIRQRIFLQARNFHPVSNDQAAKNKIFEKVGEELGIDAEALVSSLFADLTANQKLKSFIRISPEDLLAHYNLAQAQALLYKCVEMKIRIASSALENYRAIFGFIKHFRLIHTVCGNGADGYEITLTGAASLFHRSQKYGIQMAVFLPALLLCKDWKMTAEITQRQGESVFYEITSRQNELKSCYEEEPEYVNPDVKKLERDWIKFDSNWILQTNEDVIDLGKTAFIPDLVLISQNGIKIYLDVSGFWTPRSLRKRLDEFEAANFREFILAASNELRGSREEALWESPHVIFYKTKIEPLLLVEMAERLIADD